MIVDLARELRERHWSIDETLTQTSQLTRAAERLSEPELGAYLKRLARPAELSSEYGVSAMSATE